MELSQARRDGVLKAVERFSSTVYRLAYARTRNRADAEDIYQEVFLKLAVADVPLDDEERLKAWLLRVTANCSVSLFRSAWRRRVQTVEALPEPASPEAGERYEALNRALDALPRRYRAVIHLYYYEDMSVEEISTALGVVPATIRSRLSRGRAKLRQALAQSHLLILLPCRITTCPSAGNRRYERKRCLHRCRWPVYPLRPRIYDNDPGFP